MNDARPLPFEQRDLAVGFGAYLVSSTIVILAAWFGYGFLRPPPLALTPSNNFAEALIRWDGTYYRDIAVEGYRWSAKGEDIVAFFPGYPLLIRAGLFLTGMRVEIVAVAISHFSLLLALVLLHWWVRSRTGDRRSASLAVLGCSVLPTTFFFRLGYSESSFFLLVVLFLLGLEREWPLWILALISGAATGTRAPGVALVPVFLVEIARRHPRAGAFLARALLLGPLAYFGVLAYSGYQWHAFDEPLAFVKIQKNWGGIEGKFEDTILPLATLEPAWGNYFPDSPRYWRKREFHDHACFSLMFANPIYWTGTLMLVIAGTWKGWLNSRELLLALGLLAIPYFTKGYTLSMGSFGRFASVIAPVYLVFGKMLSRSPALIPIALLSLGLFWLIAYAMMFGGGWPLL